MILVEIFLVTYYLINEVNIVMFFFKLIINKTDWVFSIPNVYMNCEMSADECESLGYPILHTFSHFVDAPIELIVTCMAGKRPDGLPDWVWSADGYEFRGFVPSCVDPTYCETDPPVPFYENTNYKNPTIGSLKYGDGEFVTYTCQNPSKCCKRKCNLT